MNISAVWAYVIRSGLKKIEDPEDTRKEITAAMLEKSVPEALRVIVDRSMGILKYSFRTK